MDLTGRRLHPPNNDDCTHNMLQRQQLHIKKTQNVQHPHVVPHSTHASLSAMHLDAPLAFLFNSLSRRVYVKSLIHTGDCLSMHNRRARSVPSTQGNAMTHTNNISTNTVWHESYVTRTQREAALQQKGCVLWFTGLSGSGKSTVACALDQLLNKAGQLSYILDGDNIRHGLNGDLGFSAEERTENIRRISEVAALFADAGMITLTAFISPFRADREKARMIIERHRENTTTPTFLEVFIDTPLDICEQRDPKSLYKRARSGEIADFTGISSPYEPPEKPDIHIHTATRTPHEAATQILTHLKSIGILP